MEKHFHGFIDDWGARYEACGVKGLRLNDVVATLEFGDVLWR
jgi:hypothetical protein